MRTVLHCKNYFYKVIFIAAVFFVQVNALAGIPQASDSKISYKIIDSVNKTFGYDIYINDKLKVHQPTIPGVKGNEGFKTKADAEKVAHLAVSKVKEGKMPPLIGNDELKKLNIKIN
jgi:hypothetical protein